MPMSTVDRDRLVGSVLHSSDGTMIGKIIDVYVDTETREPEWALVHTGLFGGRESFVPLTDAGMTGGAVTAPYDKELVKAAPTVEPDSEITEAEEAELYRHYGLVWESEAVDASSPTPNGQPRHRRHSRPRRLGRRCQFQWKGTARWSARRSGCASGW